jgi:hypothetical protein
VYQVGCVYYVVTSLLCTVNRTLNPGNSFWSPLQVENGLDERICLAQRSDTSGHLTRHVKIVKANTKLQISFQKHFCSRFLEFLFVSVTIRSTMGSFRTAFDNLNRPYCRSGKFPRTSCAHCHSPAQAS